MHRLLPCCAVRLVEALDDASVLHLHGAETSFCEPMANAARADGPCVRRIGQWRVREEQHGVWKCLAPADLEVLPDVKIAMGTEWRFGCRSELLTFLHTGVRMRERPRLTDQGIVFHGVKLKLRPRAGEKPDVEKPEKGYTVASAKIRVPMKWATFAVDVWLCDETPEAEEPTMALRVHGEDVNGSWEERWEWIVFHALCPADTAYCSEHNPYLRREVWERLLDPEFPACLPLFLAVGHMPLEDDAT